jgi:ABC-type taurine transport system ATPase subunit
VGVVGDHRRDVQLLRDLDQAIADAALDVEAVVHQLQEVVLLAEDVLVFGGRPERLVELAEAQAGLQFSRGAAGGGHEPGGVLGEELLVHPRPLSQPALGVRP